jgi:hypothetical protein
MYNNIVNLYEICLRQNTFILIENLHISLRE